VLELTPEASISTAAATPNMSPGRARKRRAFIRAGEELSRLRLASLLEWSNRLQTRQISDAEHNLDLLGWSGV